jgi:predicted branched-subunit amino acid permease
MRKGWPLVLPTFALGISFGVLARPVMGPVAPIVMSITVFSGAAQFAALTVLTAGGGVATAIVAGMLMNLRWLPMGLAVGPFLPGRPLTRIAQSVAIVDASFALSSRGDGTYDRGVLIGASTAQGLGWIAGTAAGVLGGGLIGDPQALGLDSIFVAFYAALLADEARGRAPFVAAVLGGGLALALMPIAPAGVPVVAASLGALLGLRADKAREETAMARGADAGTAVGRGGEAREGGAPAAAQSAEAGTAAARRGGQAREGGAPAVARGAEAGTAVGRSGGEARGGGAPAKPRGCEAEAAAARGEA